MGINYHSIMRALPGKRKVNQQPSQATYLNGLNHQSLLYAMPATDGNPISPLVQKP
jgi:hypothetical protein